jgi:hypothetical protein
VKALVSSVVFLVFASFLPAQVTAPAQAQGQGRERAACRYMLTRGDDKYYRDNVRSFLDLAMGGYSLSNSDLAVQNMGDGASIAVLKIVGPSDLLKSDFVKAYMEMARTAFSKPELTVCAEDKSPEVTLFLLNYLREKVNDNDVQREIDSTKQYVLEQAGPPKPLSLQFPSQSAK